MEQATSERGDVRALIKRSIARDFALAKARVTEAEAGGARARLCTMEARDAVARVQRHAAALKALEDEGGRT